MAVEIVGTRIIGPVFGVNLFVWSALLAVTLASLAAGYYVGGVVADRRPQARLLGFVVVASGVALCLTHLIGPSVLRWVTALGPRGGPLASAVLLFGPCLTALGMICPIAARIGMVDTDVAGRRVGSIYAISTAGSLTATLAMGFIIVPAFETAQIVIATAVLLIVMGSLVLARHGRAMALVALLLPVFASGAARPRLPGGIEVLERAQSLYGSVQVIEDRNRGVRFMRADHSLIGARFNADGSPAFAFLHVLEAVRFLDREPRRVLQIGLGAGSLPFALHRAGIIVDVVEIDPAVVRFAQKHFGFSPTGGVYVEDGRTFVQRTDKRYDAIVHDTFTGGTTPEHLLSLEALQRMRQVLRPGGVLALNFVGYHDGPDAEASWAIKRTLRAAFSTVRAFRDSAPSGKRGELANVTFFATDGPLTFVIPPDAEFENARCEQIQRSFQGWEVLQVVPGGPALTDDENPLARLQLPAAEEHFRVMNELLPIDVWLQ